MRNKLHLHIPSPCHQEWNDMKPEKDGRFCFSCQKSVVDFTNMSDDEIISYFKKTSTGSVCGRFQENQLNRDISEPRKSLPWIKYFFQFTLPAFLISMKTEAQQGKIKQVSEISSNSIKDDTGLLGEPVHYSIPGEIKGRVIDSNGDPIQYSTVMIKGTKRGAVTDSLGNFTIKTESGDSKITLLVSSVGFKTTEQILELNRYNTESNVRVTMKLGPQLMGEVEVVAGYVTTYKKGLTGGITSLKCSRTLKDSITSIVSKFSVYPNPVASGTSVILENKKLKGDMYSVDIISLTGQTVHSDIINIENKQQLYLKIPSLAAGTYFLRLTGKKSGKSFSERIVVQ